MAAIVRDAQMNPAVIHSKRFLVSAADFAITRAHFPETEYLIEFRLADPAQVGEFSTAYQGAGLPRTGPSVDYRLFKIFNAMTDGIVAGVVIILSFLLMIIAILCLRFTLLVFRSVNPHHVCTPRREIPKQLCGASRHNNPMLSSAKLH